MTAKEKLAELLKDEEAFKALFVDDPDQTLANLAAQGIELSKEELGELASGMLEGIGLPEEELSEDALENVAGGGISLGNINKSVHGIVTAFKKGKSDKKNKSVKGMSYIEETKSFEGKGWRAIGYTVGWLLG